MSRICASAWDIDLATYMTFVRLAFALWCSTEATEDTLTRHAWGTTWGADVARGELARRRELER